MTRPHALLVDLDATLLDGSSFPDSIVRTCHRLVLHRTDLDTERLVRANEEAWGRYWPGVEHQWAIGELDSTALSLEAWRRTLAACGCHEDAIAQLAVKTHAEFARQTYRLYNDAHDLFRAARTAGIRLGLASNGAADTQRDKLAALGIEDWFDVVILSGEIAITKPDPSFFQLALDQLGFAPEAAWHVGDNLTTDVAGARAAGVTAVWLNRTRARPQSGDSLPDLEVASLEQLARVLHD
jgi:putative hydrolase of the HAD superfamily